MQFLIVDLQIGEEVMIFYKESREMGIHYKENKNISELYTEMYMQTIKIVEIEFNENLRKDVEVLLQQNIELINNENRIAYSIHYKYKLEVAKEIKNILNNNVIEKCH